MNRLSEVLDAVAKIDSAKLRELAGYYSDEAAVTQRPDILKLAIITYCLHKTSVKIHMRENVHKLVESILYELSEGKFDDIIEEIDNFDSEHGLFEGKISEKAAIKIASRLHSRGISVSQSASLTGARISDILEYVGETKGYQHTEGKSITDRLNIARDIFS
jgi:predicted transposase YdaD